MRRSILFVLALGKGRRRLIVLEEVNPMKKNFDLRWVRGWDCGWTPHGLCFSPYWRADIHDNFIIPFKDLTFSVYVDEPADASAFGINSAVLASFSKKKNTLWEGRVYSYFEGYNWAKRRRLKYKIFVRTEYQDLGNNQLQEAFHPNEVKLKGIIPLTVSSVGRASEYRAGGLGFGSQTGPTLRVLKELRRTCCLCNDICKLLDILVFSDKDDKP